MRLASNINGTLFYPSNINGTLFYPSTPDAPIGATISAKSNASILELNRLSTKLLTANHNKNHSTAHNSNRRQNYCHEWNRNGSCSSSPQQQGAEHICAYCKLPEFNLTLLRSADFVDPILAKGPGCYLFKKDLKRPYRQIPVDLKDYIFLGYRWQDLLHCKMKRAKLTPKAKLAPISRGPVWPIKVRFGLFEPKRAGQVPFRPLQNLNWPL